MQQTYREKKSFAEGKLRKENRGKTQEDENPSLLDGWVFLSLKEFSSTSLELSI